MRTHYGPWQPGWISNQHQKQKSVREPSNEHFWMKSVERFQRRRFKCEKLTNGRRTLTRDKSSLGLWPGELRIKKIVKEGGYAFFFYFLSHNLRENVNCPER